MPWGDGTGPAGMGPMTGRGAGYCAGYSVPGYMNPYGGRFGGGFGWGRGRGRFWGAGYGAPYAAPPARAFGAPNAYGAGFYGPAYSAEQEKQILESQVKALGEQLEAAKKRLGEIETEAEEEKG